MDICICSRKICPTGQIFRGILFFIFNMSGSKNLPGLIIELFFEAIFYLSNHQECILSHICCVLTELCYEYIYTHSGPLHFI